MVNTKQFVQSMNDELRSFLQEGNTTGVFIEEPAFKEVEFDGKKKTVLEGKAEISVLNQKGLRVLKGTYNVRVNQKNTKEVNKVWTEETKNWVGKQFQLTTVMYPNGKDGLWVRPYVSTPVQEEKAV